MKNPAQRVRKSIYNLLNGAVFYNATVVPVYVSEGVDGLPYQINIMEYADTDASDRGAFRFEASQVVEIVAEQATYTKKAVDEIGESVMEIIQSSPKVSSALSDSEMQIETNESPSKSYLTEESGEGSKIVRLVLRYSLLITQKNYV